jgi:hypothetical protein
VISVPSLIKLSAEFVARFALEELGDWNLCVQITMHGCLPVSGYLLCYDPLE